MHYFSNSTDMSFEDAVASTREALKRHHFAILAEIDLGKVLRRHLAADSRPYIILCACSPRLAHRAIEADNEIGPMVFCNLLVQQHRGGSVEISVTDPADTIGTINHVELAWLTRELRSKVQQVIDDVISRPACGSISPQTEETGRQSAVLARTTGQNVPLTQATSTSARARRPAEFVEKRRPPGRQSGIG
jgi:uncharacterized protein (DUF302 family)